MSDKNYKIIENFFEKVSITDELSDSSILKYKDSIKKFLYVLDNKFIDNLENSDFEIFISRMKRNGASNSRISNVISAVKKLLNFIQREKWISLKVDLDKIKKPKISRKEVLYLSEHEIKIFLGTILADIKKSETIRKVRMMALMIFLLQTGARIGEALSAKVQDIDRPNMEIPIIGKGKQPRTLFISRDTLCWIDRYLKIRKNDNEYLFTTLNGKSVWKQTDTGRAFRCYKKKSGINKRYVLHTLRHTTATQLLDKGVEINAIQFILGHRRLETTIRYYIGAIERNKAKRIMQDEHYRFIPKDAIYGASSQNSNIADVPSSPAPCPRPDNTCKLYPIVHGQEFPLHAQ
jgi:site-specific recombinase XerD